MNLFLADPHWSWWIIGYFFLGGIAAGAYFMATLIDLVGREGQDEEISRIGFRIAFPLIVVCGAFLTVDLEKPERFWHMLFKSEVVENAWETRSWGELVHAPLFKYWSPMSIGSWALTIFGLCSFISFLGSFRSRHETTGIFHRCFQIIGCTVGFFVAAYTGALLTATNQLVWSDTPWVAPLFLASAASTGIAVMLLLAGSSISGASLVRLERVDTWALGLEFLIFLIFLESLNGLFLPIWQTVNGKILIAGTLILGLVVPLLIHLSGGLHRRPGLVTASISVLLGGFMLRYGIVNTAPELLTKSSSELVKMTEPRPAIGGIAFPWRFGPEDGRIPGESLGADPGNKVGVIKPRSKVTKGE
jgi:formate-dependent nitrite reductase membrane component NrfD